MTRLIDNDVAERVLTMDAALDRIETAFEQEGRKQATFYPLQQLVMPTAREGDAYAWGHHVGAIRTPPRLAFRFKSDVIQWHETDDGYTREKFNVQPGTFMGYVLLFDASDGELLGLLNDGVIQHVRVGATAGVACDQFARRDASAVGILGSGGMATVYLEAFAAVRDLDRVAVYSPTPDHREDFAETMSAALDCTVEAVADPADAVGGADIVATCTNAEQPVIEPEWLDDGAFLTNVRAIEIPQQVIDDVDRRYATTGEPYETRVLGDSDERETLSDRTGHGAKPTSFPTLGDVLTGRDPGRQDPVETIYFDNRAVGIQFAAIGDLVYREATARGLGVEIPLSWFQQSTRN